MKKLFYVVVGYSGKGATSFGFASVTCLTEAMTMKTIQECQDEVKNKYGYDSAIVMSWQEIQS